MQSRCTNCNAGYDPSYRHCPRCGGVLIKPGKSSLAKYIVIWFLVFFATVGFLYWGPLGNHIRSLVHRFLPEKTYEVTVKPPSFRVWETAKPTFSLQDLRALRDYFETRQFALLTRTATEVQAAFERDPSFEYQIYDFYHLFDTLRPEYETLLNAWVAYAPKHFAPYLARARYYYARGWASRGHKYASETSSDQFEVMHGFFQKAVRDIDTALAINPHLLTAYTLRIGIYKTEGVDADRDAVFNEAQTLFPTSFFVYNSMILSRLPRWGGSYAEMERIAMQALKHIDANPELYMLFGQIYADQAHVFREEKQYDKAIAMYTKGISFGEHHMYFQERARTYRYMKDYAHATEDINRSISLRPSVAAPYCLRAGISVDREDLESAIKDIRFVKQQFPGAADLQRLTEWAAKSLLNRGHEKFKYDLKEAVAKYDLAIEINPQGAEAFYWRGVAYGKLMKNDLAYSDFKMAIKYNPRHFDSCRMLDYLLAREQRWDEIIDIWNQYVALEPKSGDAYFERAGTYRHKGDMQRAISDLRQACTLGKQEACKILKQYE